MTDKSTFEQFMKYYHDQHVSTHINPTWFLEHLNGKYIWIETKELYEAWCKTFGVATAINEPLQNRMERQIFDAWP